MQLFSLGSSQKLADGSDRLMHVPTELPERESQAAVISNSLARMSFNTANLSSIRRDRWKIITRCAYALAGFLGPSQHSARGCTLHIYIASKIFIQNQEHAEGLKWEVSEISHLGRWLRPIQHTCFGKFKSCYLEKKKSDRELSGMLPSLSSCSPWPQERGSGLPVQ